MKHDLSFAVLTGNNIETKFIKAGGVIFREGDEAHELFVIKSGNAKDFGRIGELTLRTYHEHKYARRRGSRSHVRPSQSRSGRRQRTGNRRR